jgi:hypothetical protein
MLAGCSRRRPELLARAVRDNLADCLVTLPALAERENMASLHFWFANFDGMRRELFPWLVDAYQRWTAGGARIELDAAIAAGQEYWQHVATTMVAGYRAGSADEVTVSPLQAPG